MKALIATAIFGIMFVSCDRDRVNVLKNLVMAEFHIIINQSADATMLLTATGKKRNVMEFTNIVKELVMNKQFLYK